MISCDDCPIDARRSVLRTEIILRNLYMCPDDEVDCNPAPSATYTTLDKNRLTVARNVVESRAFWFRSCGPWIMLVIVLTVWTASTSMCLFLAHWVLCSIGCSVSSSSRHCRRMSYESADEVCRVMASCHSTRWFWQSSSSRRSIIITRPWRPIASSMCSMPSSSPLIDDLSCHTSSAVLSFTSFCCFDLLYDWWRLLTAVCSMSLQFPNHRASRQPDAREESAVFCTVELPCTSTSRRRSASACTFVLA
mmetsp:Transcript_34546/g.71312  ORF Transcript_34546/g.71312 Transcript_34546/m.71312 type:complete len:250 (-) Transcript_34546:654-1403(-)